MSDSDATRGGRRGSSLVILNATNSGAAVAEREIATAPELSESDLAAARRAFELKLRGKRMHPRWIEENAEEIFAKAQQEYAEWLAADRVADCPRAWLVHCAWRRTQDRLDYESRHGQSVPLEDVSYVIADEAARTPEQILLAGDRREQLLAAIGELKSEHRELLKLVYFDNLEIREAGKILGWTAANASYHHKAVLKRLRGVLDGKIDLPEIGSAAAVFVALERVDAFSFAKLIESVTDAMTAVAHRLGELSRGLLPASDPASASITAGAARAVGVCGAAAAAVCLASGVIGPGVGALDLIGPGPVPRSSREAVGEQMRVAPLPSVSVTSPEASSQQRSAEAPATRTDRRDEADAATTAARSSRRRTSRPPREGGEDQVNAETAAEPAWSEPVEPRPMSSEESAGSEVQTPSRSSGGTSPATEFGL
jgi:RNA polymerase sigma factor (sigma-70 family)